MPATTSSNGKDKDGSVASDQVKIQATRRLVSPESISNQNDEATVALRGDDDCSGIREDTILVA